MSPCQRIETPLLATQCNAFYYVFTTFPHLDQGPNAAASLLSTVSFVLLTPPPPMDRSQHVSKLIYVYPPRVLLVIPAV